MTDFFKYHGLGNDYIVIDPQKCFIKLTKESIKLICDRNFGIGSDGILYGPIFDKDKISVLIFNPDGSEAEKSGNGVRIFSRYLYEFKYVESKEFQIITKGGVVSSYVDSLDTITVDMGKLIFDSEKIPVKSEKKEFIKQPFYINNKEYEISCVSIGNPHCVLILDEVNKQLACSVGPIIENHELFPNKINVQFMKIIDRNNIQIEIWERGAGYTLASGSSSCAAAGIAFKLGMCDSEIKVHSPGGILDIKISDDFWVKLKGQVSFICYGYFSEELKKQIR